MDFIGLNHYTTTYVFPTNDSGAAPGWDGDSNTGTEVDPDWEESAAPWLRVRTQTIFNNNNDKNSSECIGAVNYIYVSFMLADCSMGPKKARQLDW